MSKVGFINTAVGMVIFTLSLSFSGWAYAETMYGCPKDELITQKDGKCPVCGAALSVAQEGYIYNVDQKILDTFSQKDKDDLGLKGDSAFYVVIYKSPLGEASFAPGKDKKGNILERQLVKLQYYCDGIISLKSISDKCQILGDTPETLAKEREEDAKIDKQLKMEGDAKLEKERKEASRRANIKVKTENSWPLFYKKEKELGKNDEQIQALWEEVVKGVYEQYGYDPETDSFYEEETLNNGGEK